MRPVWGTLGEQTRARRGIGKAEPKQEGGRMMLLFSLSQYMGDLQSLGFAKLGKLKAVNVSRALSGDITFDFGSA